MSYQCHVLSSVSGLFPFRIWDSPVRSLIQVQLSFLSFTFFLELTETIGLNWFVVYLEWLLCMFSCRYTNSLIRVSNCVVWIVLFCANSFRFRVMPPFMHSMALCCLIGSWKTKMWDLLLDSVFIILPFEFWKKGSEKDALYGPLVLLNNLLLSSVLQYCDWEITLECRKKKNWKDGKGFCNLA